MANPVLIENRTIRILFLVSIICLMLGTIVFSSYVLTLQKKSTNYYEIDPSSDPPIPLETQSIQYVDNIKPYLLIISSALIFISMFCIVFIFTKFVNVFASSSKPIVNYLLLLLILVSNLIVLACNGWYIFIKPPVPLPDNCCKNPLQFKNSDGECTCVGTLTSIDGICQCPPGSFRTDESPYLCQKGCRNNDDCHDEAICNNLTKTCCLPGQTACGKYCCGAKNKCIGDPNDSRSVCCTTPCLTEKYGLTCCNITEECVPDPLSSSGMNICQSYCGTGTKKLVCKDGEQCFNMSGSKDSILQYKKTLIENTDITEDDIELVELDKDTFVISFCTPPQLCEFTAESQYFPTVNKVRGPYLDYYPCLTAEALTPLNPPPQDGKVYPTPNDLNVCIPTPPSDPYTINYTEPNYFECFQRIRPADGTKRDPSYCDTGDGKCELVNLLHENYSNPSRQDTIFRTIVTNTLNLRNPNDPDYRSYQGSFCGQRAIRIINNTVNNNCSSEEAALACAQLGAFADSKYVAYGETPDLVNKGKTRRFCNTLFECTDFSPENRSKFQSSSLSQKLHGKYFDGFKFGGIEKTYQSFIDDVSSPLLKTKKYNDEITRHYVYDTICPPMKPISDDILPTGCDGPDCLYKTCPEDLEYLHTPGKTINGDVYYYSDVCNKFGNIEKKALQTGGNYYSIMTPYSDPFNYREINLYLNNECYSSTAPVSQFNCFTHVQWNQLEKDYQIQIPLPDEIKDTIINSGENIPYKLFKPIFDIDRGNCSSLHGGIVGKIEIENVGGSRCHWSAHLGIQTGSKLCQELPNSFLIYRVEIKKQSDGKTIIKPTLTGNYTIRDGDIVIILGDDGYGNNFAGLGSFCNKEWCPCIRTENAKVPSKRDDDGNLVPDWEHPDVFISEEHALMVIHIEDDPYIYEELTSPPNNPIKWLRTDRAFSLKKLDTAEFFSGQYIKLDDHRESCKCDGGSLLVMQYHDSNPDFDSSKFMSTCTFLLSTTSEVIHPDENKVLNSIHSCGKTN